jgi:hypothetical protein
MGNSLEPKPTKNPWLVRLEFLDHCKVVHGEDNLVPCIVWAVCYRETTKAYHVVYWSADFRYCGANCETLTIGKGLVACVEWIREEVIC